METLLVKISDLKPALYNPRKMSAAEMKKLERSIQKFGFVEPVVVNKTTGDIVGGHQRTVAATNIGLTEVPVVYVEIAEGEEKALNIALNKIHGEWDEEKLAELLKGMSQEEKDLSGMEEKEILKLLKQSVEEDDFEEKPPVEPKTKLGDLYKLGEHRLLCGDATKAEDVDKLMAGEKADMAFTDPPYNTGMGEKNKGSTRLNHMFDDSYTDEEWQSFMSDFLGSYFNIMRDNSVAYICLDWRRSHELVPQIKRHFKFSNLIVWDKVVHGLGSDYKYTHEFIHVCKKGEPKLETHMGEQEYQDVWRIQRKVGKSDEHATIKPIELCVRGIHHGSKIGEVVADLFGGSGSTLIACENTGRKCRMMELSPAYCDVIISRWEKLTGKQAEKVV